jgi:hypothetical protein
MKSVRQSLSEQLRLFRATKAGDSGPSRRLLDASRNQTNAELRPSEFERLSKVASFCKKQGKNVLERKCETIRC